MVGRIGWHREFLSKQTRPCAKCAVEVPNDPDCVPTLCGSCLSLFHLGLVRLGVDRANHFATRAVAVDAFLESDGPTWARGRPLTDEERETHRESTWSAHKAAPSLSRHRYVGLHVRAPNGGQHRVAEVLVDTHDDDEDFRVLTVRLDNGETAIVRAPLTPTVVRIESVDA